MQPDVLVVECSHDGAIARESIIGIHEKSTYTHTGHTPSVFSYLIKNRTYKMIKRARSAESYWI